MTHFLYMYHQSASQSTTALVLITSVDSVSVSCLVRSSRLEAMKARLQAAQDSVRVDRLSVFLALTRADDRVVGSVSLPAVLFVQS